jgi:hypothetical protein
MFSRTHTFDYDSGCPDEIDPKQIDYLCRDLLVFRQGSITHSKFLALYDQMHDGEEEQLDAKTRKWLDLIKACSGPGL